MYNISGNPHHYLTMLTLPHPTSAVHPRMAAQAESDIIKRGIPVVNRTVKIVYIDPHRPPPASFIASVYHGNIQNGSIAKRPLQGELAARPEGATG